MKQRVFRVLKDLPGKKKGDYITAYHNITNASWFDENNLTISANLENEENFEELVPKVKPDIDQVLRDLEPYPQKPKKDFEFTTFAHSANKVVISDGGLRKLARGLTLESSDLIISAQEELLRVYRQAREAGHKLAGIAITKTGIYAAESPCIITGDPAPILSKLFPLSEPLELVRIGRAGKEGDVYMDSKNYYLVRHIGHRL